MAEQVVDLVERRIALGLDTDLCRHAEAAAELHKRALGGKYLYFMGVYQGQALQDRELLQEAVTSEVMLREALLKESPWHMYDTESEEDASATFTIPDHGDLLIPEFQLNLDDEAHSFFVACTEQLQQDRNPWSVWLAWVSHRGSMPNPAEFLQYDPAIRDYDRIRAELFPSQHDDI